MARYSVPGMLDRPYAPFERLAPQPSNMARSMQRQPANAIQNYLFAILAAEARIAALRIGLDPGLGMLDSDQRSRDSLPCDLMESVRPEVDAYVLDLIRSRTFSKRDSFETREGICRLMPSLTHQRAETGPIWSRKLGPVTERVARMLFEAPRNSKPTTANREPKSSRKRALPTPLAESNRSNGREPYKRELEQYLSRRCGRGCSGDYSCPTNSRGVQGCRCGAEDAA